MYLQKNKRLLTIALILVLTMAMAFATLVPAVEAAGIDTQAILMVGTNPIGVSQTLLVIYGVNMPPPGATVEPNTPKWEGLKVAITKPDGTTETKGPFKSDSTGTNYLFYVPKMVGKYYFQTSFPGQTIAGIYYNPSTSTNVSLTVQAEPIPSYPDTELPTYYWTRPIESQNREWWSISGNWLGLGGGSHGVGAYGPDSSAFNPYSKAPNTAHIMWTKELAMGGLVGGEQGVVGYYGGQPYSARFHPPIIINGKLYYNLYPVGDYTSYPGFTCVDLRTGETLWTNKSAVISKGQATNFDSVNEYGVRPPILWNTVTSTWYAYDAFRGDLLFSLKNAQSGGTFAMDAKGNMQVYVLNSAKNWLAMWNSTRAMPIEQTPVTGRWYLKPGTYDWLKGIEWNVTVPDTPGEPALGNINSLINPTVVIAEAFVPETVGNPVQTFVQVAYSLKKGEEGRQLWIANRTDIGERARRENYRNLIANDVFIVYHREKMHYYGYDLQTGEKLWTSDPYNTNDWAVFTRTADAAYGKLITEGMDGYVVAFDVKTGKLLWKTNPSEGDLIDAPYGHNSFSTHSGKVIADGKYYAASGEHSPNQPLWRGGRLYCLNVESGEVLWKILGWWDCGQPIIADGFLVGFNGYDNRLYCFGKGPSSTTVLAPQASVVSGQPIAITGTVTDQSTGAKGTAAISDEYMTPWMEYLYMQKPKPTNATGVQVTLTAIDPNGNEQAIGTAIADVNGKYGIMWTPPGPGFYKITAKFSGSESYYGSEDTTYLAVGSAAASPAPTVTPTPSIAPTPTPTATASPSPAPPPTGGPSTEIYVIASAAVIVIMGVAVAALVLRRRK